MGWDRSTLSSTPALELLGEWRCVPPSDVSKCSTLRVQSLDLIDHLVGAPESSELAAILSRTPRSYHRVCGSQARIDHWLINAVQGWETSRRVLGVNAD